MTISLYRIVNGRREYVGKDKHGRHQFTGDVPSRAKYESPAAMMRDGEAVIVGIAGDLVGEDEESGRTWRARVVFEAHNGADGGRRG